MDTTLKIRRFSTGVTLVEMLIVIAIAALLASIAFPSYKAMIVSGRISTVTSDLHSSLLLARSEALKRGLSVAMCKSASPNAANPVCDASANDVGWGTGWIIYVDTDGSRTRNGGEEVIMVRGPYFNATTDGVITSNIANENISFNLTGQTFTAAQFAVTAPSGFSDKNRMVCVAIGGRAKVVDGSSC